MDGASPSAKGKSNKNNIGGIKLFRIKGIQIAIDFSWFIIFFLIIWSLSAGYFPRAFPRESVLVYWIAGLSATLLFFASVLAHEIAHSLVAIRHGLSVPSITLFVFGGVSQLGEEAKDPSSELRIAAAGPLSSFVLAGIFYVLSMFTGQFARPIVTAVFAYLALVNAALGVFNLIPGFPLDGGRVLRAIYWAKKGSIQKATRLASGIGKIFAVFLIIWGGLQVLAGALIGGLWLVFIGIFLRSAAQSGYKELVLRHMLETARVGDIMVHEVVKVPPDEPLDRLIKDYFLHYGYKGFPVFDGTTPVGVVSISDVLGVPESALPVKSVREVMTPLSGKFIVSPETSLTEAFGRMRQDGRLLVMEDGHFMGLITKTGLLRFLELKRALEEHEESKGHSR
ncbi:MAG: site-2 protease family protein [Nitrospiraceae bacterium]|nr:site-2 protease family protein [Nitrospiraceae bacterium]